MSPQRLLLAVCLAVLALLAAACGENSPSKGEGAPVNDRPSMETMVTRYESMQEDLFGSLEQRFGAREWAVSGNSLGGGRTGCDDDPDAERVHLPPMSFTGTYPAETWAEVRTVVEDVGRQHGFDDVAVVKDEPGDLSLVGEDQYGARFEFGMARNTVFDVHTGCHVWEQKPSPSP